jgi:hypothetical protein
MIVIHIFMYMNVWGNTNFRGMSEITMDFWLRCENLLQNYFHNLVIVYTYYGDRFYRTFRPSVQERTVTTL